MITISTLGENPSVEDLRRFSGEVAATLKDLDERKAEGRTINPDEFDKANTLLAEIAEKSGKHEAAIKAMSSRVPGWASDEEVGKRLNLLLEVPDEPEFRGVDKAYFNLMSLRSEELLGATQIGERYLPGMDKRLQKFLAVEGNGALAQRHHRMQQVNDAIVLKYKILSAMSDEKARIRRDPIELMRTFREWPEWEALSNEFARALVTTGGTAGGALMPTLLSSQMADMVEIELKVAGIFPTIPMASKTYEWPIQSSHLTFFVVPESTSDTQAEDTSLYSTPGIARPIWTLSKFLGFCVLSSEVTEDTILPALPFVQQDMVASAALAIEDAIINGERSGTTMDGATYNPAKSAKRGWNGLRFYSLMTASYPAKIDNAATNGGDLALNAIAAQAAMLDWGVNPEQFVWIAGFKAYHKMRTHAAYRTMDQIGDKASTLRGQVGIWEGSPVILSAKVELQKSTGVYGDGLTRDFGSLIGVRKDRFVRGIGPGIDVETSTEYRFNQDQIVVRGRFRQDFEPLDTPDATHTPVSIVYDIA